MNPKLETRNLVMLNALTIDVEDYFHVSAFESIINREDWPAYECRVESNTRLILSILREAGVKATFFILGWVAERFPELVKEIASAGHEIASHGYAHQLIYNQSEDEFRADLKKSIDILEGITGEPVLGYRAPSYSITRKSWWALNILVEAGLKYDSSIFPIHHDRYGIPDFPRFPHQLKDGFYEFPISTLKIWGMNFPMAGGGYFRLLPYPVTRWAINRINNREGQPVIFYLHPWEFDPDQPRQPIGGFSRFRHYVNLDKTEVRFRRLLEDFRFAPVKEVLISY